MTTRSIIGCTALVVVFGLSVETSHAHPKYKSAFDSLYPNLAIKRTSCSICHLNHNDDAKKLNHYGEALAKELGEPKVGDLEKIKEALLAIESGDCKTGQWGRRINAGLAPCIHQSADHELDSYIGRQLRRSPNSQENTR